MRTIVAALVSAAIVATPAAAASVPKPLPPMGSPRFKCSDTFTQNSGFALVEPRGTADSYLVKLIPQGDFGKLPITTPGDVTYCRAITSAG